MEPNPRKVQRLKLSGDFRSVREKGSSVTGKWLVLGVLLVSAGLAPRITPPGGG